ncbi:MAG TPA: hypothetical protein ENK23_06970 [Sorangium sp.]|nr:hypothetical protein [Sorangium sp.]
MTYAVAYRAPLDYTPRDARSPQRRLPRCVMTPHWRLRRRVTSHYLAASAMRFDPRPRTPKDAPRRRRFAPSRGVASTTGDDAAEALR